MRSLIGGALALVVAGTVGVGARVSSEETARIQASAVVLGESGGAGAVDADIPQELWENAQCVVVIPSLKKAAFGLGGEYGKGLMSCRHNGVWGAPVFMELQKGSWGFQIGGESIDLVLLVNNQSGVDKMLQDKVSLGADASVAAGPVGRHAAASTNAQMNAQILSYSRAQGIFAGIDVSGGVLRPDVDANRSLYGQNISARAILTGGGKVPVAAEPFMTALRRHERVVASQK
jgi:SH3 domain-containing YSC84-like protein 1